MKVRKGDTVKVITGKDRGKRGKVLSVRPDKDKVVVEGVNVVIRHQKSRGEGQPAGRINFELPIHVSNVQVVNPETDKPARVGYEIKGGKKVRVFKGKKENKAKKKSDSNKPKNKKDK